MNDGYSSMFSSRDLERHALVDANTMGLKTAHISNNIWRCTMSYRPWSTSSTAPGRWVAIFQCPAPMRRQPLFISHEVPAIVIYYSNLKSSSFSVTSPFGAATRSRLHFEGGPLGPSKCSLEMEIASGLCQSGWKRIRARLELPLFSTQESLQTTNRWTLLTKWNSEEVQYCS